MIDRYKVEIHEVKAVAYAAANPDGDYVKWTDHEADLASLREQVSEWIKANAPGGWINDLREQLAAVSDAIGTNEYLDPPDGGSVTLAEQVQRMRSQLAAAQAQLEERGRQNDATWGQVLEWEKWAADVLRDFRVPFDNHKVALRLGIVQLIHDAQARVAELQVKLEAAHDTSD